ncbi:hypothetical protein ACHAQH_010021 [Verticillium albo-atrum]
MGPYGMGFPDDGIANRGWKLYITSLVMIISAGLFVIARCATRFYMFKLGWDDLAIVVSLASSIIVSVAMQLAIENGYGMHKVDLPKPQLRYALKLFFIAQTPYKVTVCLNKVAAILLYLRIFVTQSFRTAAFIVMGIIVAWSIGGVGATIWQCVPIQGAWNKTIEAKCIDSNKFWIAYAVMNILTDVMVLVLPIPSIMALQLGKRDKLLLCGIFMLGGFVTITSILRTTSVQNSLKNKEDITWNFIERGMWTLVEANLGIISACLPVLKQPMAKLFPRVFGSTRKNTYYIADTPSGQKGYNLSNVSRQDQNPGFWRAGARNQQQVSISGGKEAMEGRTSDEQYIVHGSLGSSDNVENATVVDFNTKLTKSNISEVCEVNVFLTHPGAKDRVRIQHYLPLENWKGRYQGNGGSGLRAGRFDNELAPAAARGFVSGATNAGLPANSSDGSPWANDEQLIRNFASLSVHEMTVVGKALAEQFYGSPVRYAYWNGCSTGGRQGFMEAQRYPEDYDGIFAAAPAINYASLRIAQLYPFFVQADAGEFPPQCIWEAFNNASVQACDELDGAEDGVIGNPTECLEVFEPYTLTGQNYSCNGNISSIIITQKYVDMWRNMTLGPLYPNGTRAFHGIAPGTSFRMLASTSPASISSTWVRDFIMGNSSFDLRNIDPSDAHELLALSNDLYQKVIGTDDSDLSRFRDAGGKLLSWHGWSDESIFANGTIDYRLRVEAKMGGADAVDDFFRLFMAPGVEHCDGGEGAVPNNGMTQLMDWVEKGKAPDRLAAMGNGGKTRNLCRFPKDMKYVGKGDVDAADSWGCE